ncbi:MAG: hypothetical protein HYY30_12880 [Chloroflexi bacterium]|nr:hypothetical protein [Chloroflexota bacterium]
MSRKMYWAIGGLLLTVVVSVAYLALDSVRGIEKERSIAVSGSVISRLETGMAREQAEQAIGADSKKRYRCGLIDVHLIGSSDPSRAAILFLRYGEEGDGTPVLERIAGLDQDQLFEFEYCSGSSP